MVRFDYLISTGTVNIASKTQTDKERSLEIIIKALAEGFYDLVLKDLKTAVFLATILIIILFFVLAVKVFKIDIMSYARKIPLAISKVVGRRVGLREKRYHRDIAIGILNEKSRRVKVYRFLNDLTIDLNLKKLGATPYSFLFLVLVGSIVLALLFSELVFSSWVFGIILSPIAFAFIMCILYTRANIAHDARIEAVIESENIICNSIKDGVKVAVRNSLSIISEIVREQYKDFLNELDNNVDIRTALLELGNSLGSISADFIKKCIVFELEEEEGFAEMFQDIVELNNRRKENRTKMKRRFEEIVNGFLISTGIVSALLVGVIALYPFIANFYFNTTGGRVLLGLDMLVVVSIFVYITYLRAQEL